VPKPWWAQELANGRAALERWARNRTSFDPDAAVEIVAVSTAEIAERFQGNVSRYPAPWFGNETPGPKHVRQFQGFVRTVVLRRIHDRLRRHYAASAATPYIDEPADAGDLAAALDARRALEVLGQEMDRLPDDDRELLLRGLGLVPASLTMTNRERQQLYRLRRRMLEILKGEFKVRN
jgi:hypothetical protein